METIEAKLEVNVAKSLQQYNIQHNTFNRVLKNNNNLHYN